jgi:aspartate 1-decarboxylase
MQLQLLKSKIHRVKITQAELHYVGSITLDENLMDAAQLFENEKVQVVNVNNGERLETYVIKGRTGIWDGLPQWFLPPEKQPLGM